MAGTTSIEWTDKSWNPVTGCESVSPGCDHCYARTLAERFRGVPGNAYEQGFDLKIWPDRLALPLNWRKPSRIFVNSMSDLFHKDIPDEYIQQCFETMNAAHWHTFQVLTKRPSRAALIAHKLRWTPNIWLGTSVENNDYIWRVDKLTQTPAHIKFISAEPLLGELTDLQLNNVDWVIAGAESGHGARTMNEDWVRHLRDLCQNDGVAFFYKQNAIRGHKLPLPELDGKVWQEFPVVQPAQVSA
jgi:protein gp37